MQAPEWNTQDKAGSLNQWIHMLNNEARRQFLESGTHIEIFFLFNNSGLMEIVPVVGMEKEETLRALKKILKERDGYAFIHIAEGTMRDMDSSNEADLLLVHAESRDGLGVAHCNTVAQNGPTKMLLDTVTVDGQKLGGPFAGLFQDL